MFGIKTKKDKRIEELEMRLHETYLRTPRVITQDRNSVTFGATIILEDGVPIEYAKDVIAKKMIDEAKQFIEYDIDDSEGRHRLTGYLVVLKK